MANFPYDDVVLLAGIYNGTELQWSSTRDWSGTGQVIDAAGPNNGNLSTDDTFDGTHGAPLADTGPYTGWYVQVELPGGGTANYGIFETGNSTFDFMIPYDSQGGTFNLHDLIPSTSPDATLVQDTTLENAANCFLAGTQIATIFGPRAIETLKPGDRVVTADGSATRVRWLWTQEIVNIFGLAEDRVPIRITANALGPQCPRRDLLVTADHAIFLEGCLVNAGALVNDTTIHRVRLASMPGRFTYYHVETDHHCLLLAENCPSESFIDYLGRDGFDNHAAYLACGGKDAPIREMPVPRISTARLLPPALKWRLGLRRVA